MDSLQAFRATAVAAFALQLKHYAIYLKNTAIRCLNVPAQVAAFYFLWSGMLPDNENGQPARMLSYYSFAFVVRWLFGFRSVTERYEIAIYEGDLLNALVRPMPYAALELGRVGAQWVIGMILLAHFFLVTLMLGWVELSAPSLIGCVLLLVIGGLIQYLLYSVLGVAAFWLEKVFGLVQAFDLVMLLCSGTLLPLDLYPAATARLLRSLPFRFFVYSPVQALLTPVTWTWVAAEAVSGLLWVFLLGLALSGVWRMGMKRFTGQGV